MEKLKEHIHLKRPNLSSSSLTTYTSILKNLYHKVFGKDDINFEKFDECNPVLSFLKDMPPNRRKTILSALVIITDKKPYRELMMEDVRDYNQEIHKQEKTPEQEASWVSTNDVKTLWEELKRDTDLIYKKKGLKPSDLQQIQSFIIMSLLGGVFIPPRRSKDYVDFLIKDVDKDKDNYFDKNKMVFNSYKTAKTYGQQTVDVPKPLQQILKKWISVNPTKTLLFDSNMNPLSSVKLNQRINKLFDGKKVSVNQMRHTYLTNKFGHTIDQKKAIDNTMSEMGSSSNMLDTYVKK
jgi:integrase